MIVRMDATFEQAKQFFRDGLRHYEAGRFEQAHAHFEASLALVPQRASTLTNLGATRIRLGRFADAATVLQGAIDVDPADAQAWGHLATALAEGGERQRALACTGEALARNEKLAAAWTLKGTLLHDFGRDGEAAECFRHAIDCGGDPQLNGWFVAALTGGEAPAAAPGSYVKALFDSYAPGFEQHLVGELGYRAPEILVRGLHGRRFDAVLDLGCGTGLVGEQLQALSRRRVGVDISTNMVEQARARGAYSQLVQADALDYLRPTQERFELVVAAEVFIYIGDLEAWFAAVHEVLAPGGVFAFTVELAPAGASFVLRPSLRYAHSADYIRALAQRHGFDVSSVAEHPIRLDRGAPLPGLFAWLARR